MLISASLLLTAIFSGVIPPLAQASDCQGEMILSAVSCAGDGLSAEENLLYQMVNQYRQEQGKEAIAISSTLTRVANRHLLDWEKNAELFSRQGRYWRLGWSDCPYNADDSTTFDCVWKAPQRLSKNYSARGYEIICLGNSSITAKAALDCWKQSQVNRDIILGEGEWSDYRWKAIGIGIELGRAVIWFSTESDSTQPQGSPTDFGGGRRIW
jgi:hypothetical protein